MTNGRQSDVAVSGATTLLLPTAIGALAVLAGSTALSSILTGTEWLWPMVQVIVVTWLIGYGGRLSSAPAVLIVALQVMALVLVVTARFTFTGYAGIIPNASTIREMGELFAVVGQQIASSAPPVTATTEISFLCVTTIGFTALTVDVLIGAAHAPALVAIPLLALYSVPATVAVSALPWQSFAAPALLYLLLLALSTRASFRGSFALSGAATAAVIAGVTVLVALLAAGSVTGISTEGRNARLAATGGSGGELSPFAALRGELTRNQPLDLLRLSGLDQPAYVRTIGLEKWTPGQGWSLDAVTAGPLPAARPAVATATATVTALAYESRFLPLLDHTVSINGVSAGWQYDEASNSVFRQDPIRPAPYTLQVSTAKPTSAQLRADTATGDDRLTRTGDLPESVTALTAEVTGSAPTAFDKALALTSFFTDPSNGFSYSLTVPAGDTGDALTDFLQQRQGYCQQYASAMAVMLRAAGLPARVALGFTGGTRQSDGSSVITSSDAHAWVELRFDGAGWVRFDPTPPSDGRGGQQGFGVTEPATSSPQPSPTREASPSDSLEKALQDVPPPAGSLPTSPWGAQSAVHPTVIPGNAWSLLALAAAALLAASPTALRRRRRRRRLAVMSMGGPAAGSAAWAEIEDLAVDHGLQPDPTQSARGTAKRLARAMRFDPTATATMVSIATAAEQGWYGPIPAPATMPHHIAAAGESTSAPVAVLDRAAVPPESLAHAVTTVQREMLQRAPLSTLDHLAPRSLRQGARLLLTTGRVNPLRRRSR